jgi:Domain of unknown function (DUF3598)
MNKTTTRCQAVTVQLLIVVGWCCLLLLHSVQAFHSSLSLPPSSSRQQRRRRISSSSSSLLFSSSSSSSPEQQQQQDAAIQWELFQKHHARGSWKGIWTTYDYIGDVLDETVASVNLEPNQQDGASAVIDQVDHTHTIVIGAKRSDCQTCFDSMETRTFPVAKYTPDNFLLRNRRRLAGVSMVIGPTIISGAGVMVTELVLKHGDGRIRVIFHHAPAWEKRSDVDDVDVDLEPLGPPQGLKLFRVMLSREALRDTAPTAETEQQHPPPQPGNPVFYRPVPPFDWHKKWSGTSWTWGPQTGNRGWSIDEIEELELATGQYPYASAQDYHARFGRYLPIGVVARR